MFTFEKDIPENTSISSLAIKEVLDVLDKKGVPVHSLLIMKDDKLIFEKYYSPYKADTLHRLFSISKTMTALAISLLIDEGKVHMEDSITMYFPEYAGDNTHPWIKATTIENMLMMRTCHASTTYKADMKSDWVESFFKVPPTHKPGTVFHYDTSSAHTLCALVEKLTGMPMLDYLKEKVLGYMDFSKDSYMIKDPFGVSMGGSGLMATPMDLLKVTFLLHKGGTITCNDGVTRSLLSKDFAEKATSNLSDSLVPSPLPSEAQGYGMQIWQNERGGFVLYGMGGQLGISIPSKNMLIVTTADTQGMAGGNQVIYDCLYKYLVDEEPGHAALDQLTHDELLSYAETLRIAPPRLPDNYRLTDTGPSPDILQKSFSRQYTLYENPQGFTNLTIDIVPSGTCSLVLTKEDKNKASSESENALKLSFAINDMAEGLFPIYNCPYTAGAVFLRDNVLYIRFHLIGESVGSVRMQFFFGECDVTLFMRKVEETYFKEFDGHLYGVLS